MAAQASRYPGVGVTWTVSATLLLWSVTLADGRRDTEPIFTLSGALIGAAAGFYYMYHQLVMLPLQSLERRGQADEARGEAER